MAFLPEGLNLRGGRESVRMPVPEELSFAFLVLESLADRLTIGMH